jgi:hypothetical protein
MSSLTVRTVYIIDRACEIMRHVLRFGVHRLFVIARSHYENIDLPTMSQGFMPSYSLAELEEIKDEVAPLT